MPWILSKKFVFEASHVLPNHDGKCARLHGHSWQLVVYVAGADLIKTGPQSSMVVDYAQLKRIVQPFVDEKLDHCHLNDSTGLDNPTSEALAQWIFEHLSYSLPGLCAVKVHETCTTGCKYTPPYDVRPING
jgi:6-pyruvoyltetrahydropterin/6-carboxytetrahydropterin synthase